MTVGGFIGVLIIGLIVGLLARFITPGPNPRGIIVTIVIGIVGAFIATLGGQALGLYAPGRAGRLHRLGGRRRGAAGPAAAVQPLSLFISPPPSYGLADRLTRKEVGEMVRLIDATPVPLGRVVDWAKRNGRVRGLKMHVVYDPEVDNPTFVDISHANVNDIEIGRTVPLEACCTYVFDKAYCRYDWWISIDQAGAGFVTRMKTSARFRAQRWRTVEQTERDGFTILHDAELRLVSKGDPKLDIPMRRIRLKRHGGGKMVLLTGRVREGASHTEISEVSDLKLETSSMGPSPSQPPPYDGGGDQETRYRKYRSFGTPGGSGSLVHRATSSGWLAST